MNQTIYHNFWRGNRVRLRAIEQHDLDELLQLPAEPDSESERADDSIGFPLAPEQERRNLVELMQRERTDGSCFLLIENQEGIVIGNVATFDCDRRVGTFKYSIVIKRPFWRHGYGREAVTILLRYYFRELRFQKCTILVYSFNEQSLQFHEQLGFIVEGRLRRVVYTNGQYFDEVYLGLTTEEFDCIDPNEKLVNVTAHQEDA